MSDFKSDLGRLLDQFPEPQYKDGDRPWRFGARSYEAWRRTVPWTNQQIADALYASAESLTGKMKYARINDAQWVRNGGRVSGRILSLALPILSRLCKFCERPALYIVNKQGRCARHRDSK